MSFRILCLGLSHHTAPVELRELLNYSPSALKAALARFGCGRDARPSGISELVILSTCNRLELYACVPRAELAAKDRVSAQHALFGPLLDFLVETRGLPAAEFETHLYRYADTQAIEHLCRVAAGLDSMILGEPQILGQVAEAHEAALSQSAAGPVLAALFRTAIRAGKRARTETAISRNPASVSSVAVKLAESVLGDFREAQVLVVGGGEMAEMAVEALRARGAPHLTLINRTHERAAQMAQRWNGQALTYESMADSLIVADIVITSTGAPHFVIPTDLVRAAIVQRAERPLVFIDIAVPRDVDPDVGRLPNVYCYDIDDLHDGLDGAIADRQQAVPVVESLIAEEVEAFTAWLHSLDITPVIADLRAKADALRRAEVEKTLRRLPHLGETDRQRIEALTESVVNKLLHDPTVRLKAEAGNGHAAEYAAVVRHLFALEG